MQITIHRGSHEVGGTCVEVSSGNSRIILDIGMPLFGADRKALNSSKLQRATTKELREKGILPDVEGLFEAGRSIDGILISHAHMDHTGLLDRSQPEIPVYASTGTSKMMLAGKLFARQIGIDQDRHQPVEAETPITVGNFRITGFPVDHSIFGCLAFLIEADGKSILYTGDLRLHGRKPGMTRSLLEAVSSRSIDLLLMEGTHFGFADGKTVNEYELEDEITQHVADSPGLVLASFSPQHVDRLVSFIRAAIKTGRTFVVDAYTAFVLHLIGSETDVPIPGESDLLRVFYPKFFQDKVARSQLKFIADRFQSRRIELDEILATKSKCLMVFRASMLESDFSGELPDDTTCLYSRWSGYLESDDWSATKAALNSSNGSLLEAHTSGHMLSTDIPKFVKAVAAKSVVPIHTFEPAEFSRHFDNVLTVDDGQTFEVV